MKTKLLCLSMMILLALAACSGGGSSTVTTATNTINGVANLGVVVNGIVTAFKLTNGIKGTQLGNPATTQPDGTFSIDVGTYTGAVVLELSNPNSNATFIDEATGNATALPTAAANNIISSVLPAVTTNQAAAITPLTDMIATAAINSAKNGTATTVAIVQASTLVANAFGLDGIDPLTTLPTNLKTSAGTGNAAKYASVLAGIANIAANNTTTATVNTAVGGAKLIAQTKAYAQALFNTKGSPQAPTALTTGESFAALRAAINSFNATPAAGLNTPAATSIPTGATYAGNTYYYVFQEYRDNDQNIDFMERGLLTLNATANIAPKEAWDYSFAARNNTTMPGTVPTANMAAAFSETLTVNQNGTWFMPNAGMGGNISADGLVFAGVGIKNGATSNAIVFGVKKPIVNLSKADMAGRTYDFTAKGTTINTAGFKEVIHAIGNVVFSANGNTLSYTATETVNGTTGNQTTTANINYTITADGLLKIVDNAINMVIYIAPSAGGKYAIWSEASYRPADGRQLKSVGFAIQRSNIIPNVGNTVYHYFNSYWTPAGLNGAAGPQVEQATVSFSAAGVANITSVSIQQVISTAATAVTSTIACGVTGVAACTGPTPNITFTGGTNGSFTITDGVKVLHGFASSDGNIASTPGTVIIKR